MAKVDVHDTDNSKIERFTHSLIALNVLKEKRNNNKQREKGYCRKCGLVMCACYW